jgi:hypothetical protein
VAPTPAAPPAPASTTNANSQSPTDAKATPANQGDNQTKEDPKKVNKKKESSSKKKKGLKKLIPW